MEEIEYRLGYQYQNLKKVQRERLRLDREEAEIFQAIRCLKERKRRMEVNEDET